MALDSPLKDASNIPLKVMETISLIPQVGQVRVSVHSIVITNMAADFILGTAFLNVPVKPILPKIGMVLFPYAPRMNIIGHTNTKH